MKNSASYVFVLVVAFMFLLASCGAQTKEVAFEDEIGKAGPKDITLASDISAFSPEDVAKKYYEALNSRDYRTMYALISDGFKEIEETANTFETFEAYMSGFYDTAKGVNVLKVNEVSNDGKKAAVDYVAEIILLNEDKKELKSTFTMKKADNGWKLIHPYGEKIDMS